ncbi:MAG TPA: PEP-CTERM sorting domain-containing protein, partial [Desulfobaccales bacterium]|nr:PEP-CTERM sorting domain-containing protein [Desulfobaccales bacterium]
DWAFLGNDYSPWNDFALFYLKDQSGNIVFSEGLAQLGTAPPVPLPSTLLLLGSGLCGLLGLGRRVKRRVG